MKRGLAYLAAASLAIALTGCGGGSSKTYDISPIFPLSTGKCAKYGGVQQGSGLASTCLVTKAECEKAASDWREEMQASGVNDAIEFRC